MNPPSAQALMPLLSPTQLAEYLGIPVATLQTWRAKRIGPPVYRVGKHVRYRVDDVERGLADRNTSDGESPP